MVKGKSTRYAKSGLDVAVKDGWDGMGIDKLNFGWVVVRQ